jgi:hypothetical protein
MPNDTEPKVQEKHQGISTKIRERLQKTKENVKEKVNPYSETNKAQREEKRERQAELQKAKREAYEKEEIRQASEHGKQAAQRRYAKPKQTLTKKASSFVEGTRRSSEKANFGRSTTLTPPGGQGGYFDIFGRPQKKKPVPVKTTVVNPKTGKITITEPVEQPKKKAESYGGFDMLTVPELHTGQSYNPFDIEVVPSHRMPHGKGHKKKRGHPTHRHWNIGDLY